MTLNNHSEPHDYHILYHTIFTTVLLQIPQKSGRAARSIKNGLHFFKSTLLFWFPSLKPKTCGKCGIHLVERVGSCVVSCGIHLVEKCGSPSEKPKYNEPIKGTI